MADAILRRTRRLELTDLPKVVDEGLGIEPVEPGPEGRLRDGHDAAHRHPLVVLRRAGDGVVVGLDDLHGGAAPLGM